MSKDYTGISYREHFSMSGEESKEGKGESGSFTAPYSSNKQEDTLRLKQGNWIWKNESLSLKKKKEKWDHGLALLFENLHLGSRRSTALLVRAFPLRKKQHFL